MSVRRPAGKSLLASVLLLGAVPAAASPPQPLAGAAAALPVQERPSLPGEAELAATLLAARADPAPSESEVARLVALGPQAAEALLDALITGCMVAPAADPDQDPDLREMERQLLRAALERLGRPALHPLALRAVDAGGSGARRRALLALELAGRAQDLELAADLARSADPSSLEQLQLQRDLERSVRAILSRDAAGLGALDSLLASAPQAVAMAIVRGTAACGRPEAVRTLAEALDRHPPLEPLLLCELARAATLGGQPADLRARLEVRERLTSPNPVVARAAATAAGVLDDSEASAALITLLQASSAGVRSSALSSLRQITGLAYGCDPDAWAAWYARERDWYERRTPALAQALSSPESGRAIAALRELAVHRYRRDELAALAAAGLEHPSPLVRRTACSTLGALGCPDSAGRLRERLDDEDRQVAQAARASLATLGADVPVTRLD